MDVYVVLDVCCWSLEYVVDVLIVNFVRYVVVDVDEVFVMNDVNYVVMFIYFVLKVKLIFLRIDSEFF